MKKKEIEKHRRDYMGEFRMGAGTNGSKKNIS